MPPEAPLAGIRLLDLADGSGATCGRLLATLGAETILVEPPSGSPMRRIGPFAEGIEGAERSLFFWHGNAGKRSVTIDLDVKSGQDQFLDLVAGADVVIESFAPGELARRGLSYQRLLDRRPDLVLTSITPFGQDGPYAEWRGSDLVCQAMGGMVAVNGPADGRPLPGVGLPAYHGAGIYAAIATLLALRARRGDGHGQWIDVSIQAAVTASMGHATSEFLTAGRVPTRRGGWHWSGDFRIGPAADGHVVHSLLGDWTTSVEWLRGDGKAGELVGPEWTDLEYRRQHGGEVFDTFDRWSQEAAAAELCAAGQLRRLPMAPVREPDSLREDPHLVARRFFVPVWHEDLGQEVLYPGPPFRFGRTPAVAPSRAPLRTSTPTKWSASAATPETATRTLVADAARNAPLAGIRVVDFTWVVAGPLATRILTDFGADVIKIERLDTPSVPSRRFGLIGSLNRGKRSVAIDLAKPQGLDLARRLIACADVVADNFSSRVMANFGLQHDDLVALRRDIVTASLSGFGESGPYRDFVSYGPTLQALAGHTALMRADRGGPPLGWGFSYSDMVAGTNAALAILAALWHRDKHGEGQHIEISQFEALVASLGPGLLSTLNATLAAQTGPASVDNYSREMPGAPQGVFRCADQFGRSGVRDRWCAIAIFKDTEWERFRFAMGNPGWSRDGRFSSPELRLENREALHDFVETWTRGRAAEEVVRELQAAGVAAGIVAEADDLANHDPQLRSRNFWQAVETPEGLRHLLDGVAIQLARTPGRIRNPAPLVGEHTEEVLRELLGLSDAEIEGLSSNRVIQVKKREE